MKEYLYEVGLRDKKTGEKIKLRVWAFDTTEATRKVATALFGFGGEYAWTGSGPIFENNCIVFRNIGQIGSKKLCKNPERVKNKFFNKEVRHETYSKHGADL